ncbi:hypothetical protein [Streptomyces sp. NPDC046805]|uniref:hypothetical protein n=1 Tax=Streptomyces sp. NPDC046805 TaxID=3155134 RepID=UPI0033FD265E
MFRRTTTVRAVIPLLAATLASLLTLLVPQSSAAPAGSFAPAHTVGQAAADDLPGFDPSASTARHGADTFRDLDHSGHPGGTPQARERRRTTAAGWEHPHPAPAREASAIHAADLHGPSHHRTASPSRALSPAALQVFRC